MIRAAPVRKRQQAGRDERDERPAIMLSKALLLAGDTKIADPVT